MQTGVLPPVQAKAKGAAPPPDEIIGYTCRPYICRDVPPKRLAPLVSAPVVVRLLTSREDIAGWARHCEREEGWVPTGRIRWSVKGHVGHRRLAHAAPAGWTTHLRYLQTIKPPDRIMAIGSFNMLSHWGLFQLHLSARDVSFSLFSATLPCRGARGSG